MTYQVKKKKLSRYTQLKLMHKHQYMNQNTNNNYFNIATQLWHLATQLRNILHHV